MPNKILVADDSQTIRSVAEFLLRQKGYEVVLAQDGEEALTLIRKTCPELVLVDNYMPIIDGYALCQELKKDHTLMNIPVVMLLNSRESVNQEGFRSSGCVDFILKPFSPREFLEKVQESLRKEKIPEEVEVVEDSEVENLTEQEGYMNELKTEQEKELEEKTAQPVREEGNNYERFVSEFKKEMEGLENDEPLVYREMKLETPAKEEKEEELKDYDHENLTQRIVKEVSVRVAEKIAEKIDAQEIEQMIKERVKELV